MIKMTAKEVRILTSFFKSGYSVKIGIDNTISLVSDKVNKFEFQIFPVEASDQIKQKAKEKGIDSISKGIRQIQKQLTKASRNDRFKNLPPIIFGKQGDEFYFYQRGKGGSNVNISDIIKTPSKKTIESRAKSYHVYSMFNALGKTIHTKNYTLSVLDFVLNNINDSIMKVYYILMKGFLLSNNYNPTVFIYMKSSKPINNEIVKSLKEDENLFHDTKFIEISKPSKEYLLSKSNMFSEEAITKINELEENDTLKMRGLSPIDRGVYSKIMESWIKREYNLDKLNGESVIVFDDTITTGGTFVSIMNCIDSDKNEILPMAYIIRK